MARTKAEIQADIAQKKAELAALEVEMFNASIEVYLVMYDVRDEASSKVIGLPPATRVDTEVLDFYAFFEVRKRRVTIGYKRDFGDEMHSWYVTEEQNVSVDDSAVTRCDGDVHLRAFTSRDKAEACLAHWVLTAGTSEYE